MTAYTHRMTKTCSRPAAPALLWLTAGFALLCVGCKNGSSGASKTPAPASSLSAASGGSQQTTKPYTLSVTAPAPGKVGSALTATVKLVPRGGYKVNLEYPTKLIVRASAASTPEKTLTAKDAAEITTARALFKPSVTLTKVGTHDVKAEFKFSVCTKALCELKRETLTWRAVARGQSEAK